jgi:hypothetical protein
MSDHEPTARELVHGALEDASMYQDLGNDARDHAASAKRDWSKLRDRLDTVKQDHQQYRETHKLSTWLHDKGLMKSNTLAKHEDRQRRYTEREADAHNTHVNAREEVQRLDRNLGQAQDQARDGWQQLEQEQRVQRQGIEPKAVAQNLKQEQPAPSQKGPADRFTGELLECGPAPYLHKDENSLNYFVKLRLDDGKEATHWGVDLERAMEESNVRAGDRIKVAKTGQDRTVEVKEDGQEITTTRRGWSVTNLSHEQSQEQAMDQTSAPVAEHAAPEQEPTMGRGATFAQRVQLPRSGALDRIRAGAAEHAEPEHVQAIPERPRSPEIGQSIPSPNIERPQAMTQQSLGYIELPRTKQELQQEQSRQSLGQRVLDHNVTLPEPQRRPTLGHQSLSDRVRAHQQEGQVQAQEDQGQGSGGRRGGQERPSHSSYYQPVPVGGMATPTPDERSADIQQQDRKRRRDWSRSM